MEVQLLTPKSTSPLSPLPNLKIQLAPFLQPNATFISLLSLISHFTIMVHTYFFDSGLFQAASITSVGGAAASMKTLSFAMANFFSASVWGNLGSFMVGGCVVNEVTAVGFWLRKI
ncbi:hypothetical protein HYFRA_00010215 [Hymenoscyphus fraxineus]|uniref:Uncharacterized protein n=1 Tax=Hymenoscyphus fraxineus TaxID=746836 RepID=A0A9N9PRU1_9HELO|nr:hypothetical protein HYFRA_00010215 [Hymenoscyphus fraxineus]